MDCPSMHVLRMDQRESCICCNIQSRSNKSKHVRTYTGAMQGRAGIEAGKGGNNMVMMLAIMHLPTNTQG